VRLGIDATSVAPGGKGIARVQRGTVEALRALDKHELVVFARHPEELPGSVAVHDRPALRWEQLGLPRVVREHRLDALLTWSERLPLRGGSRYLVWLFEPPTHRVRQNRLVGAGAYQRAADLVTLALWRRSLRRADVVFTGSQATADAIGTGRALYPGLDARFTSGPGREGRYVLHIATPDPRDDTETALAAFARVAEPGVTLVVAGSRPVSGERVEYVGRVSDEELVRLYRGAAAYLDTSLYEGFGYQVLEAMACGAPVVATAVTSIPEIVAGAALLAPARDVAALGTELARVLREPALAVSMRERGLERAREFTWERTARQIDEALA